MRGVIVVKRFSGFFWEISQRLGNFWTRRALLPASPERGSLWQVSAWIGVGGEKRAAARLP